jgi:16S rRNA (cytosine1402-N4)-methyltransferase
LTPPVSNPVFHHIPVLIDAVLEHISVKPNGTYVDCTVGGGGHARVIADHLGPGGRLIGLDRDQEAIKAAAAALKDHPGVTLVRANFAALADTLRELNIDRVDGVLFDLGISSPQVDHEERGFSYQTDAPLDMRMDTTAERTARDLVNHLPVAELARIIYRYGEERWAGRIAEFIDRRRQAAAIETTGELVQIIKDAIPAGARRTGPHPARRTFQALRIAVNNELENLELGLDAAVRVLAPGGRVCVISFHSLEDRVVKTTFQELARGCCCPADLPVCVCGRQPVIRIITRKPVKPGVAEVAQNRRARSAKLRVAEKL